MENAGPKDAFKTYSRSFEPFKPIVKALLIVGDGVRRADEADEIWSLFALEDHADHAIVRIGRDLRIRICRGKLEQISTADVEVRGRDVADFHRLEFGDVVNLFSLRRPKHSFPALDVVGNGSAATG